jgi:MscS family membrane protein
MHITRSLTAIITMLTFIAISSPAAHAQCTTPLSTVQSLLDNLQAGSAWKPSAAAACFPMGQAQSQTALHLKQILDARGLFIDFKTLPADPEYTNAEGQHVVVLHKRAPKIYLVKREANWIFSPETVNAVPQMYRASFSGLALTVRQALPAPFHKPIPGGVQGWQLMLFGLLAFVALLSGRIAHLFLQHQVVRIARRLRLELSQDFVARMQRPLTLAASGAVFMIGIPDLQFGVRTSATLYILAQALLSGAIMVIFLRLTDMVTDLWAVKAEQTDTKLDDQLIPLANRAAKIVIWALGLLSILDNLGVDITSLLAGVTISGLAVALAAKDTVENLFGSVMIFVDRPFQIGDYIEVGGVGGTVEEVGFRSTRLRTLIGSVVTIPNGSIATAKVNNMGLRTARRMRFNLGFTYAATREQINDFCQRADTLIEGDERLLDGHEVAMVNFGDSAIEVMIHAFAVDDGWSNDLKVNHDIRMKLWELSDEIGLSFAFPSQSIYVESLPKSTS